MTKRINKNDIELIGKLVFIAKKIDRYSGPPFIATKMRFRCKFVI